MEIITCSYYFKECVRINSNTFVVVVNSIIRNVQTYLKFKPKTNNENGKKISLLVQIVVTRNQYLTGKLGMLLSKVDAIMNTNINVKKRETFKTSVNILFFLQYKISYSL